jgi:hypothetical protein
MNSWSFFVNNLAILYAGALCQLTASLIGEFSFCILIRPIMVGAEEFKLIYFHISTLFMSS